MGCVFFGVLHYPGDQRQQIELSSRVTHTEDPHGHPGRQNKGRRRTAGLRHERERAQRDAQKKHVVPHVPQRRELPALRLFRSREGKGERVTISSCYDCYWSTTIKHARTQAHHSKAEYVSLVIFHLENLIQTVKGPNTLIKLSKEPRFHGGGANRVNKTIGMSYTLFIFIPNGHSSAPRRH